LDPPEDEPPSLKSYDEDSNAFGGQEQDIYNDPTDPDDPMASPEPTENDQFFDPQQQQQQGGEYYESPEKQNGPGGQEYYETQDQGGQPDQGYYQEGDGAYQTPGGDQYAEDGQYEAQGGSFGSPQNDQYPPGNGHFPHPNDAQYYPEEEGQYDGRPDDQGQHGTPGDDRVFENEEKKAGGPVASAAARRLQVNTGEDDFVPIKRDGYMLSQNNGGPSPRSMISPRSAGDQSSGAVSKSSALRGAQELLKRNRQRRMEM
jgi:hypothetical protein